MKALKHIPILVFCLLLLQCGPDPTISETSDTENATLSQFQQLDGRHQLRITDNDEPGEKLLVCATLVNKANKDYLPNQKVRFYHTNNEGDYEPVDSGDESSARLSGDAYTNMEGRIYIETILPGDYGSSENNRHIHTSVFGAKPEAYDINFNQYTGTMGRNFINGSDQHFLADLKRAKDSTLVCFITIDVKNPNTDSASD